MGRRIVLSAGEARATVLSGLGGSLASLSVDGRPVLRPWSGRAEDGPFAVASFVLAPFSNRVSRPFKWRGAVHELPRNVASERFPIHGDAFARAWRVDEERDGLVRLALHDGGVGPLLYRAELVHALSPTSLLSELSITSRSAEPMPFGAGFHPAFPRDGDTCIEFSASGVWLEDKRYLPTCSTPVPIPARWDFSTARLLPADWINNGFHGWTRTLRILQRAAGVPVDMEASAALSTLLVYSPGEEASFFCAEPVSHPVDAHNLPGQPGLVVLAPGETLAVSMRLAW